MAVDRTSNAKEAANLKLNHPSNRGDRGLQMTARRDRRKKGRGEAKQLCKAIGKDEYGR